MASFQIFCLYSGPRYQVSVYRTIGSLEPHDSMGISKKIYEKKISKTILKKKNARDPENFQKVCVHVCVCVFVCRGSSFRPGWSEKNIQLHVYIFTQ